MYKFLFVAGFWSVKQQLSIPVVVSFQVLAWVRAHKLNSSSKTSYSNLVINTKIPIN